MNKVLFRSHMKPRFAVASLCVLAASICQAAPTLTLLPSGSISGAPGATIGWGFTLTNPDNDFITITSSNFCMGTTGVTNSCVPAALGLYQDFIANAFLVSGPSPEMPSITQPFDMNAITGIGSITLNPSAPVGSG